MLRIAQFFIAFFRIFYMFYIFFGHVVIHKMLKKFTFHKTNSIILTNRTYTEEVNGEIMI